MNQREKFKLCGQLMEDLAVVGVIFLQNYGTSDDLK